MLCLGQAHQGLSVGFLLLRYSVVFTVESLSLFISFVFLGDDTSIS